MTSKELLAREQALVDAIKAKDGDIEEYRAAYSKLILAYYVPLLSKHSIVYRFRKWLAGRIKQGG